MDVYIVDDGLRFGSHGPLSEHARCKRGHGLRRYVQADWPTFWEMLSDGMRCTLPHRILHTPTYGP